MGRPNAQSAIRLPPISLPEFDGDYKQWLIYRDTFDTFVHRNRDLTNIQRLHYLKSSLKSEAAQVIESLETTAANYLPAWEQLRERYDNNRRMVGGHINALCTMPSIVTSSSANLRKHQNGINSHLWTLKALNLPVEHWDAIIIRLMVEKLDVESHSLWESSSSSAFLPSIQEYLAFLHQRCLTLESIETSSSYGKIAVPCPQVNNTKRLAPKKRSYTTAFATTDKSVSSCTLCPGQHALYTCQGFLGMTVSERREHVRSKRLCTTASARTTCQENVHADLVGLDKADTTPCCTYSNYRNNSVKLSINSQCPMPDSIQGQRLLYNPRIRNNSKNYQRLTSSAS